MMTIHARSFYRSIVIAAAQIYPVNQSAEKPYCMKIPFFPLRVHTSLEKYSTALFSICKISEPNQNLRKIRYSTKNGEG